MTRDGNVLKVRIIYVNRVLESLCREMNSDEEKIRLVKSELDNLLYQYYKNYRLLA